MDTVRNYQQAGLIAYVDDDRFARLSAVAIWNTRQVEFGTEIPYAGALSYGGTIAGTPGERTTWLRLAHRTDADGRARVPGRGQPRRPALDLGRGLDDAREHHTPDRPGRARRRVAGRGRVVRLPADQPVVRRLIAVLTLLALAACTRHVTGGAPVQTFTNPVFADNFPDPGAILADGAWHAYGTNNPAANVPVLTSPDLVTWTAAGDALPEVGKWANPGNTWAPEVIAAAGGYLLYYTARSAATDRQCIGVAFSATPGGPFTDDSAEPLICQASEGGSIDASPYLDAGGALWLLLEERRQRDRAADLPATAAGSARTGGR